ncbi:hypothetical protein ABW19_dt0205134 [Dactylella cylindrospora]|nr:hypothetical protein ABW19_dt0205134 [Dactylella cylindrospora]
MRRGLGFLSAMVCKPVEIKHLFKGCSKEGRTLECKYTLSFSLQEKKLAKMDVHDGIFWRLERKKYYSLVECYLVAVSEIRPIGMVWTRSRGRVTALGHDWMRNLSSMGQQDFAERQGRGIGSFCNSRSCQIYR